MLGAIIGDIVGSAYEWDRIKQGYPVFRNFRFSVPADFLNRDDLDAALSALESYDEPLYSIIFHGPLIQQIARF